MGFFSKDISTMDDLFVHMLRDIYYAEQDSESVADLEKATNPDLRSGLQQHLAETRNHVHRATASSRCIRCTGWNARRLILLPSMA
jgi:ferritin-like metal-binding protein YciE